MAFFADNIGPPPSRSVDPFHQRVLFTSAHGLPWADNCRLGLVAGPRR